MSDETHPPSGDEQDPWLKEGPPSDRARASAPDTAARPGNQSEEGPERRWEREVLTKLALATVQEQRRARRWGIFFKSLFFVFIFAVLLLSAPKDWEKVGGGRHTALVELDGEIAADKQANADNLIDALRAAFRDKGTAGVIIRADSPGGSPVQAGLVNDEIFRLRKKYPDVPVYAVVTDICASGCYYIISAADKIYADKASLVGSIGVLMNGFGFTGTLSKLGIERRLITSGKHKAFLDPFSPLKEQDRQFMQKLLDQVHRQFIDVVKKGRGSRLKPSDKLFSGLVWTGADGVKLGLVDGLRSTRDVAREVIGADKIVDYTRHPDYFQRLAQRFGASMGRRIGSLFGLSGTTPLE